MLGRSIYSKPSFFPLNRQSFIFFAIRNGVNNMKYDKVLELVIKVGKAAFMVIEGVSIILKAVKKDEPKEEATETAKK
jgi:Zn finger protein HypA/HybF involved in hydrogenase expression